MTNKIRKYKRLDELSVAEHVEAIQAKTRGEEFRAQTDEYRGAVAQALAGLDGDDEQENTEQEDEQDDAPATDAKLGAMTVDDHFNAITHKEN